ncbi:four-carbon acid sugar kinase family protein [Arcicella sp. LKC2W]|uniref:four-carbon acid sugar kinase family protein n=1 Tax=Arcicella sp. LKC2W TaxID=2984198 RepID=UPI002B1F9AAA|nr:four-carbon acid sugar kinase family protein [Arcicella sp. LKC2W]MEA5460410.1 four-carbon acid sugar kinase family protein [Arcicella sp. LKC2W]
MKKILLAFYGDDFTGSTDALEFITTAGAKSILFIDPPSQETLAKFPNLNAFGVAGKTRALPPEEMEEVLMEAFTAIKSIQPQHIHYKVCSTFDSSQNIGSIGKAIDCGLAVFQNKKIPVIGGTPALGRYCVFGNLFAQMGIGSQGNVYRLDRHPSMSKHPVTPSSESDLRIHLSKQTTQNIGLLDFVQMQQPQNNWADKLTDEKVILIDALYNEQMPRIGAFMEQMASENSPLFSVGGSGVEMALGGYWNKTNILHPKKEWKTLAPSEKLLVVSGSCSPISANQIKYAKQHGFDEIILDALAISKRNCLDETLFEILSEKFETSNKIIVHTGDKKTDNLPSEILGNALGLIAKYAVEQCNIKRVVVAGGDTSSYAARAMQIKAVEMITPVVKGAPLCKAYSDNVMIEGLEVNFKGGQVGSENYFTLFVSE